MMPWEKQPVQPDYNEIPDFLKRNDDGSLASPSSNPPAKDQDWLPPWGPSSLFRS